MEETTNNLIDRITIIFESLSCSAVDKIVHNHLIKRVFKEYICSLANMIKINAHCVAQARELLPLLPSFFVREMALVMYQKFG